MTEAKGLNEQLRSVPKDARLVTQEGVSTSFIPIGEICHRAANLLESYPSDDDVHEAFNHAEFVKYLSWERQTEEWCKAFAHYLIQKLIHKSGEEIEST